MLDTATIRHFSESKHISESIWVINKRIIRSCAHYFNVFVVLSDNNYLIIINRTTIKCYDRKHANNLNLLDTVHRFWIAHCLPFGPRDPTDYITSSGPATRRRGFHPATTATSSQRTADSPAKICGSTISSKQGESHHICKQGLGGISPSTQRDRGFPPYPFTPKRGNALALTD